MVNRELPSLHGGSLESTRTVSFSFKVGNRTSLNVWYDMLNIFNFIIIISSFRLEIGFWSRRVGSPRTCWYRSCWSSSWTSSWPRDYPGSLQLRPWPQRDLGRVFSTSKREFCRNFNKHVLRQKRRVVVKKSAKTNFPNLRRHLFLCLLVVLLVWLLII